MNSDVALRHKTVVAAKEIKASAHYQYIVNGITLDGSKFTAGELVTEGQCLVMDDTSKKYEKYVDGGTEGSPAWPTGKSNPVILDESIMFTALDDGSNGDQTAGQVLVHGSVYTSLLTGCTTTFKTACKGIYFVE